MQVHRHMEDAHGIFHNIDSILTMVFLEPFEKQVWPAILQSLPFFFFFSFLCLVSHFSSADLIARVISPLSDLISKVILEKVMPRLRKVVEKAKGKMGDKSEVVMMMMIVMIILIMRMITRMIRMMTMLAMVLIMLEKTKGKMGDKSEVMMIKVMMMMMTMMTKMMWMITTMMRMITMLMRLILMSAI